MKILLVISKFLPEYSGPGLRLFNTYQRLLIKKKIKLQVYCQSEEQLNYKEYTYKGINVKRFSSFRNFYISKIIKQLYFFYLIYKISIISNKYDVFHVVGNSQLTNAALYVSRLKNKPLFFELVNASAKPNQRNKILDLFFKINLNHRSVIACLSKQLAEKCYNWGLKKNVWIKPNPVNQTNYNLKHKDINKNNLLYISQFMLRKNQIFLIEVMKHLPKNFILNLAGPLVKEGKNFKRDNEYFNLIKLKIKKYGLEKNVFLMPYFVETHQLLKKTNIYLMPSFNEGLGTTLLESLCCGIPVICNKNEKVFNEYIIDDFNGKLLELNPKLWAEEIIKIYSSNHFDEVKISQNIYDKVSSNKIDQEILKILNALVNSKSNDIININKILS